nr:SLAP domain-containing protein [Lactobacillus amylovorus]
HNAYIYRTSTQRTPYGMTASSKKWKFYKGKTVTTYGGSYKFKNGKRYFRVGGPRKQYIKSYNLGPVISSNISAATTTTTSKTNTTNT